MFIEQYTYVCTVDKRIATVTDMQGYLGLSVRRNRPRNGLRYSLVNLTISYKPILTSSDEQLSKCS